MTIKMRKLNHVFNNIIKEELQKGYLPSSSRTISRFNGYIKQHDLSLPSLTPSNVGRGDIVSSDSYIKILDDTHEDLTMLYNSLIKLYNMSTLNLKKYEVDKQRLEYQINKLRIEAYELSRMYLDNTILNTVHDNFIDMMQVDTSLTDASVDIVRHEVTIRSKRASTAKVNIPSSSLSFKLFPELTNLRNRMISGSVNNILTDAHNEVWKHEIISPFVQPVGGYVTVKFLSPVVANKMVLTLHTVKSTMVNVEYSTDGTNWLPLPYYQNTSSITDTKTYDFPEMQLTNLRLSLTKKDSDSTIIVNGVEHYSYIIGIKELAFYNFDYVNRSTFVSRPLVVQASKPFAVDKVSLETNVELPTGTWINYWVGLPAPTVNWIPINPTPSESNQVVDFKNIETAIPVVMNFPSTLSPTEREMKPLYVNGITFYRLGSINGKDIIPGSERLYRGKSSWRMDSIVEEDTNGTSIKEEEHIPTIDDWINIQPDDTKYIKFNMDRPFEVVATESSDQSVSYKLTMSLYVENQSILTGYPLCNCPITIYLNGKTIFSGMSSSDNQINYLFSKGWNEIIILVYKHNSIGSFNLNINIDITKVATRFYAEQKPLSLISIFDLQYNTPMNSKDSYSIVSVNNENVLVLNHYITDVDYEFWYKYPTTLNSHSILFKAELCRDDAVTKLSPKLKSYRIVMRG